MYHQYFVVIDLDKSHMTLTIVYAIQISVFVIAMSLFKIFTWNLSIMYSRHILHTYYNVKDVSVNLWPLCQGQIFEKSENTFFVSKKPHCSELYQIITTCECDVLKSFSLTLTMTVSQGHVSKVMEFMNLAIAQSYQ